MITQKTSSNISSKEITFELNRKWKENGVTIAGGNDLGKTLNQLSFPQGIFVNDDKTIYIADWWNDRIMEWKSNAKTGYILAGGNGRGSEHDQLYHPTDMTIDRETNSLIIADCQNGRIIRYNTNEQILISDIDCLGVTIDKDGSIYVSDCVRNEVRRWKRGEKDGIIVAGGNGKGDHFNQLNYPTFIFIDDDYSLYVSDMNNHRVMKWLKNAKEGIVVAGGNGNGDRLTQLAYPEGVKVDQLGKIYIADSLNHRVMRWHEGDTQGTIVVGGNGQGKQSNQLNIPTGLSFDRESNLYVVDCFNHRIQKFEIDFDENNLLN